MNLKNNPTVIFTDVELGERFRHNKRVWRRVPKAVDKLGGYNAQLDGTAKRRQLFFGYQQVELFDDGREK